MQVHRLNSGIRHRSAVRLCEHDSGGVESSRLPLCNGKPPVNGPAILLDRRGQRSVPPSNLNQGIPGGKHILSHVFGRGQSPGQTELTESNRGKGREKNEVFLFLSGRHLWPNLGRMGEAAQAESEPGVWIWAERRGKIDSVYLGEFTAMEFWRDAGRGWFLSASSINLSTQDVKH